MSSALATGSRVTVFALCGMMVGFFVQDALLMRNKKHVEASVDAAFERALATVNLGSGTSQIWPEKKTKNAKREVGMHL